MSGRRRRRLGTPPRPAVAPIRRTPAEDAAPPSGTESALFGAVVYAPSPIKPAAAPKAPPSATPSAAAKPKPPSVASTPSDVYVDPLAEKKAEVVKDYKKNAEAALTKPGYLKELNATLKAEGKPPMTADEAKKAIAGTDVKPLSDRQYETVMIAAGSKVTDNPATAIGENTRADLAKNGPYRLAKDRVRVKGLDREPTPDEVQRAKDDLERIDPSLKDPKQKPAVYVNLKHAKAGGAADPKQTNVAPHEFTHILLYRRGVTESADGKDVHHELTGKLGWNAKPGVSGVPGETKNWKTGP